MKLRIGTFILRLGLCGLAVTCAPPVWSGDLSHFVKRDQVPAVCGPNWGYHQTCWRRFSPMPPCSVNSQCEACLDTQYGGTSGFLPSPQQMQPQQMQEALPYPSAADSAHGGSPAAEQRPVSVFPEQPPAAQFPAAQPPQQQPAGVPMSPPATHTPPAAQPGSLPPLPAPLPPAGASLSQQRNPAVPVSSSHAVPTAPVIAGGSGRYAPRDEVSATSQFLQRNTAAPTGRYGSPQPTRFHTITASQPAPPHRNSAAGAFQPASGRYQLIGRSRGAQPQGRY